MAIRLALLPLGGVGVWSAIKSTVLDNLKETVLDELKNSRVLESIDPPSFGHSKRWESAQAWLIEHQKAATREEAASLVKGIAVRILEPKTKKVGGAIFEDLLPICRDLSVDQFSMALCDAGASEYRHPKFDAIVQAAREGRSTELASFAPLLAVGLSNALRDAKKEGKFARRDQLLEELRALALAHPKDGAVREHLAAGLCKTLRILCRAKTKKNRARKDQLLKELEVLSLTYPDDQVVCQLWLSARRFRKESKLRKEKSRLS
jgi:hypothetical protein